MNIDALKICKDCQFVLNKDSNQESCPNCGSKNIKNISDIQEPLASVDVLHDWFDRLDPAFRSRLIDLFALASTEEEKTELLLKLSKPNKKETKTKEIELILNSNVFDFELHIYEEILNSIIIDAVEKNDPSAILILEKTFGISFPILRKNFVDPHFKYSKTYSDGIKNMAGMVQTKTKPRKKLRNMKRLGWISKPHFTTDEFDAAMTSTRGMDNIQVTESINESMVQQVKELLGKGLTIGAIGFMLNISPESVLAISKNEMFPNPINISQTENVRNIVTLVARTIYTEARGETYEGKLGVASVIWNRAKGNPDNFIKVIRAKSWNNGIIPSENGSGRAWADSLKIASTMINGTFDPIFPYTHFLNPEIVIQRYNKLPVWAREKPDLITTVKRNSTRIGKHVFLFDK